MPRDVDTGLPSDALRWVLEYFITETWGSESLLVISETLEEAGAPELVLDTVDQMWKAELATYEEGN